MSEGSTSRGSGVKAIIADLQQKIAESDGECARVDRGRSGRSGAPGGRRVSPLASVSRARSVQRVVENASVLSIFVAGGAL